MVTVCFGFLYVKDCKCTSFVDDYCCVVKTIENEITTLLAAETIADEFNNKKMAKTAITLFTEYNFSTYKYISHFRLITQ